MATLSTLKSHWTTVLGCRVHARVSSGQVDSSSLPVVLVHGFGVSSLYFVPLARRLMDDFRVYVPDLPGHGKSATPRRPLDIPQFADALVAWMDAVGLSRVSVVGNSMGCQIAVEAAMRFPDRFDRLALVGPTVDPAASTFMQQAWRLTRCVPYERMLLALIVFSDYVRMNFRLFPELRFMLQDRIEEKLPKLQMPIVLMRGRYDAVAPMRWLFEAARLAGTDRLVDASSHAHAVHFSDPDGVARVIRPFLKSLG